MIKPVNKHYIVEVEKREKNEFGVIYTKENQTQERGRVLGVPERSEIAKKGDVIYFKSYSAIPVKISGKEFHLVKEEEILAIE